MAFKLFPKRPDKKYWSKWKMVGQGEDQELVQVEPPPPGTFALFLRHVTCLRIKPDNNIPYSFAELLIGDEKVLVLHNNFRPVDYLDEMG